MARLSEGVSARLQGAFHPKTQRCYSMLFRTFVAFCVFMDISMYELELNSILCF